jgi:polyphosphate glucokinase
MKVLVIDVGGSHVKILVSGQAEPRVLPSGRRMDAAAMCEGVKRLAADWPYDAVAIGYPGVVRDHRPVTEPHNLAKGWVGFDYAAAFGKPVRMINDAAMQALGAFRHDKMLFLGLGTGLGSALVVRGHVLPMELAHLPYRDGSFEDHVGGRALERDGKRKWRRRVADVVRRLTAALVPDEVVLGGGNARLLDRLPDGCRTVDNSMAFAGGFRLWADAGGAPGGAKDAAEPRRKRPAAAAARRPVTRKQA